MKDERITPKVLLVDDDPAIREVVACVLRMEGCSVVEAHSGKSALTMLANAPEIRLIVSDFQMPDGDGVWLFKNLRALGNALPFILITGSSMWTDAQASELGIHRWYSKPFSGAQLEDFVRSVRTLTRDRPR